MLKYVEIIQVPAETWLAFPETCGLVELVELAALYCIPKSF